MSIYFLSLEDILEIHRDQIARYGGREGIRDQNLLLSAIAQPQAQFGGKDLHPSMFEKAAAYLFHICKNHPFVDGNKRVGLASMLVFLDLNDQPMDYVEEELERLTLLVAEGRLKKDGIVSFLSEENILNR